MRGGEKCPYVQRKLFIPRETQAEAV
jgi:hypothetical protein